jgi:RNA polymerase sigma factor for flagellar operon FliA
MRIRGCIIDKIRAQDWLPRSTRKKIKDVKETAEKLRQELGRPATSSEIGEVLGITKEKVDEILAETTSVGSLYDKKGSSDESIEIIDTIEDTSSVSPLDKLEERDTKKELQQALMSLPPRERDIMVLYYQKNMTLKEIGEKIEVSESRVCQLHAQAIMKLKNILSGQKAARMKKSII